MLDELKALLGDAAANYTDAQLNLCIKFAMAEVEQYCNREIDFVLELVVLQIAKIKVNRNKSEGLGAQSFSGVSESFIDGYPDEIKALLRSKRKMKVL